MKQSKTKTCCLLLAAALLFCGCGILPQEEELRTAPVVSSMEEDYFSTEEVKSGDVVDRVQVYCYYQKQNSANYGFEVVEEGITLKGIYVQEGDVVKAGTVLAELELGSLGEEIEQKQQAYDELSKQVDYCENMLEFERQRQELADDYGRDYDDAALTSYEEQLEGLNDRLHIAQLELDEVSEKLSERQLVAEFDGVVSFVKQFNPWEWLRAGETMVSVESENAAFIGNTDQGSYFPEGMEVNVTTTTGIYQATVTETKVLENGNTRLVMEVKNPDNSLVINLRGTISAVTASAENVTYIPYAALRKMGDQYAVYVQDADGLREIRYVEVGLIVSGSLTSDDNRVEIVSGLNPGETVIIR